MYRDIVSVRLVGATAEQREHVTSALGQRGITVLDDAPMVALFVGGGCEPHGLTTAEVEALVASATVVPIYCGDPRAIVAGDPALTALAPRERRLQCAQLQYGFDECRVAAAVFRAVTDQLDWTGTPGIIIDQRGQSGPRTGTPPRENVPDRFFDQSGPVFVFRPNAGERTPYAGVYDGPLYRGPGEQRTIGRDGDAIPDRSGGPAGRHAPVEDFAQWWSCIWQTLGVIQRRMTGTQIRIAGAGQPGVAVGIGRCFGRLTPAMITAFARPPGTDDYSNSDSITPPATGEAGCNRLHPDLGVPEIPERAPVVDLLLVPEHYLGTIRDARALDRSAGAAVWVETGMVADSASLQGLIADVIALLERLKRERSTSHARIYTTLPFHALPILAAGLTYSEMRVTHMEERTYVVRPSMGRPTVERRIYTPLHV